MKLLRLAFFALVIRPVLLILLGVNLRGREKLPISGPAVLAANHNSHLDTLTLIALFPLRDLPRIRPVAAMDYFLKNRFLAWFATNIIGILPIDRQSGAKEGANPLEACEEALVRGDILILFPEGSRGEPERLSGFKKGIAHLARGCPDVPVIPIFMYGLGRALPKGSFILVPFNCDIVVGDELYGEEDISAFMTRYEAEMKHLASDLHLPVWE
ncbi:1-acyl-sn-glycerol-3-phosphate acyltransferase [Rhizobiales bacterium]|uniref:lysophospholipid acyltransferase family protein n=1 Tax=Hongsoonwoonella zoysiae TaxID=2821844 RepID=UPI00156050C8|nr:lysophospholipid acyltransferase family protein [Hongsoonwoonella zoysiae]NRG19598.1 1-acyl-sn-glycerol-3-phosphate acyltransferase [Hongsoonwoonella zoysiae]